MAKWRGYGRIIGSQYLGVVEAPTKEKAEERLIIENGATGFCYHCSRLCEDAEIELVDIERLPDGYEE